MAIDCRNVVIGEILLGAGYLIGAATSQPTVVAISAPGAIQEMAADMAGRSGHMGLWLLVACSMLLLGLYLAGRRRAKYAVPAVERNFGAAVASSATWMRTWPDRMKAAARTAGSPREKENPFDSSHAYLRFEDRVQMAARQSLDDGCIMGVVCLSLHPSIIDWAGAKPELKSYVHSLADELRGMLQKTDCVQVTEANEIVVFVTRLRGRDDLLEAARRLSARLGEKSDSLRFAAPGFALYPLHGYTSTELIEAARKNIVFVDTSPQQPAGPRVRVLL